MRRKLFSLLAALFLLGACESTTGEQKAATGTGGDTQQPKEQVAVKPEPAKEKMMSKPVGPQSVGSKPVGPKPGSVEHFVATAGDRVFFDLDKFNLQSAARDTLQRQADWLKQFSNVRVTIEGHCDERGTREYNLALGERRANAAKDYLVGLGIDAYRIATISYGKERPEVLGSIESAWSQNRRAFTMVN